MLVMVNQAHHFLNREDTAMEYVGAHSPRIRCQEGFLKLARIL